MTIFDSKLKRVLVIHPRELELSVIKKKLELKGLSVRAESDSLEAMHLVRAQAFDLIIVNLDLNTKVSGFELIRLMRMGISNKKTPVALIGNSSKNRGIKDLATRLNATFVSVNDVILDINKLLERIHSNIRDSIFLVSF